MVESAHYFFLRKFNKTNNNYFIIPTCVRSVAYSEQFKCNWDAHFLHVTWAKRVEYSSAAAAFSPQPQHQPHISRWKSGNGMVLCCQLTQQPQQHSGGSGSSSSNGRFPQNGSFGRKAQPLVGSWNRVSRRSCGHWRERTEEYGGRRVRCDGRRRGVLLLQRNSQCRRQEEDWETQHQRSAALHPDCRGQWEGRRLPGVSDT